MRRKVWKRSVGNRCNWWKMINYIVIRVGDFQAATQDEQLFWMATTSGIVLTQHKYKACPYFLWWVKLMHTAHTHTHMPVCMSVCLTSSCRTTEQSLLPLTLVLIDGGAIEVSAVCPLQVGPGSRHHQAGLLVKIRYRDWRTWSSFCRCYICQYLVLKFTYRNMAKLSCN